MLHRIPQAGYVVKFGTVENSLAANRYQYPLKFRIFIGNRDFDLTFPNFNSGFSSFFHIALSEVKMT